MVLPPAPHSITASLHEPAKGAAFPQHGLSWTFLGPLPLRTPPSLPLSPGKAADTWGGSHLSGTVGFFRGSPANFLLNEARVSSVSDFSTAPLLRQPFLPAPPTAELPPKPSRGPPGQPGPCFRRGVILSFWGGDGGRGPFGFWVEIQPASAMAGERGGVCAPVWPAVLR